IRYSKEGYLSIRNNLSVSADGPLDTVTMVAAPSFDYYVRGTVTAGGVPVSGATVSIISLDTNEDSWWGQNDVGYTWTNTTNETGFYRISDLPYPEGGLFGMRVESADHYTVNLPVVNTNPAIDFTLENITADNNQNIGVRDGSGNIINDATVFMYEEDTSTWTDATKFGGATYVLSPNTGSTVYVYAYHEDHKPVVTKLSDVSGTSSFDMVMGENNLGDDDVIYIPSTPSYGTQSDLPMINDRIMILNMGPTAKISGNSDDYVVTEGGAINFSASSSISVVGISSYDWGGDNLDIYYNSTFSGNPNVVSLTVTDNFGATDTVTVNVTADADNPVASFTSLVKENVDDPGSAVNSTNVFEDVSTVVFNATDSSDVTSSVASYSWTFGDGNTDTGKIVSHSFETPGTFDVVLTVADGAGNTGSFTSSVIVHDITPPSVNFNWSYVDSAGVKRDFAAIEGIPVNFNAGISSDNSGKALTYEWDFSDGTNMQGKEVTHTFENVSSSGYEVLLIVTDEANNSNQRMIVVSVEEMDRPDLYISELSFSNDNPKEDETIQLNAVLKLAKMNVTGEFEVGFYLDTLDNQIGAVMVDGTNLTKGIEGGKNVSFSWKAVSGTHTIFVVADSTNLIAEGSDDGEKNNLAKDIQVTAKESSNDTSIILLVLVVMISIGAVGYIYKDSLFGN
ncbi:MAG: PKD domain-containing protein, partial [Candidatus Poseidoniia archaeon]|nr:PKD domain-containing protein [Candidatus Poseidoniia archaeon]